MPVNTIPGSTPGTLVSAMYSAVWRDHGGIRVREVPGPTGSLVECAQWRDGQPVSIWEELRASGLVPLVRTHGGSGAEVFAGVRP